MHYKQNNKESKTYVLWYSPSKEVMKLSVLSILKKEIIDKINSYFGYKLINEIKLQSI